MAKKIYKIFIDRNGDIQMNAYKSVYCTEEYYFIVASPNNIMKVPREYMNKTTLKKNILTHGIYFDYYPKKYLDFLRSKDSTIRILDNIDTYNNLLLEYNKYYNTIKINQDLLKTVDLKISVLTQKLIEDGIDSSLFNSRQPINITAEVAYNEENADNNNSSSSS